MLLTAIKPATLIAEAEMWNEFKRQVFGIKPKAKPKKEKSVDWAKDWEKERRELIKNHHKRK